MDISSLWVMSELRAAGVEEKFAYDFWQRLSSKSGFYLYFLERLFSQSTFPMYIFYWTGELKLQKWNMRVDISVQENKKLS